METKIKEIEVNGVKYVPKDSLQEQKAESLDGMPYCIVRTYSAGVFAGYIKSRVGQEVIMTKARCLWYWSGATTLSQLATTGSTKPQDCKFTCEVDVTLINAIEILEVTDKAKKNIQGVAVWQS
jgi:hypothetical protein